jgi:drug/metabolite transporter (DMT)-like permease
MDWLPLTLICAFSLATADAATKAWLGHYSARELALVRLGVTGLLLTPWLPSLAGLWDQPLAFWGWVGAMLPLEMTAMLLYMRAIRDHPLALTLPYLAFTPVFVILTGYLLLGEQVSGRGGLGILLVVIGAWLLNRDRVRRRPSHLNTWTDWRAWVRPLGAILDHPGSRAMLLVAFLYSLTSVMGKGAMRHMPPETFGSFYFVLLGVASFIIFALPAPSRLVTLWRRPWAMLAVAGINAFMVYTHFLALARVEVAYMIAVKRTSLLFGILYGAFWFHEQGLARHLAAGSLMVTGILLILD